MLRHLRIVLALALACIAVAAVAGEKPIGKIVSASGADTSNDSTATPFFIAPGAKLTIWCNASAWILTDSNTAADMGTTNWGQPVSANEKFPTSVGTQVKVIGSATAANGGAVVRIVGPAAVTCFVSDRKGDE